MFVSITITITLADALVEELSTFGTKVIAVPADVSQESAVETLFKTVDEQLGTLTALVNNVGVVMPQTTIEGITAQRVNRLLQTNVTSYFLCCREAVKRMANKHGGAGGAIVTVYALALLIPIFTLTVASLTAWRVLRHLCQ